MTTSLLSRIARKVINERAVLTHCPVHNTPLGKEIIMNEKDYSTDTIIGVRFFGGSGRR